MSDPSWWKLTFSRKTKSEPKVLYGIPPEYGSNTKEATGGGGPGPEAAEFSARLEKIVDKSGTKGRHVKVSQSGRFKEKKKVRPTLSENPDLFGEQNLAEQNHQ